MRREFQDELLRSLFAFNTALRAEVSDIRRLLAARNTEAKYNPNWRQQPRAPRGVAEGGQWVEGGGGGPKQLPRVDRPIATEASPQHRLTITNLETVTAANDNAEIVRLPLRAIPLAPISFALPLYGDTPRPRTETRRITSDLVVVITESNGRGGAQFYRIVTPQREVPIIVFGVDTGLTTVRPAQLEHLYVFATVQGDAIEFSRTNLELAYGREIPDISGSQDRDRSQLPQIVPLTQEERRLDFNLRHFGMTDEQVGLVLQSFRTRESDGESLTSELRRLGVSRRRTQDILRWLRIARRDQPYRPPTSGAILEIFPDLARAPSAQMVYPAVGWNEVPNNLIGSERATRSAASALVAEMREIDPTYEPPNVGAPAASLRTREGRVAYIEQLRQDRAALLFLVRGELQPLQVEVFRFLQQRVDVAYAEGAELYDTGQIRSVFGEREHAIGNYLDRELDRELRALLNRLGISTENELVRVHRGENITLRTHRTPDARVGDVFFDFSVAEKRPSNDQVGDYFRTVARPRYVLIVRPRQRGQSYIITPPPNRYARD